MAAHLDWTTFSSAHQVCYRRERAFLNGVVVFTCGLRTVYVHLASGSGGSGGFGGTEAGARHDAYPMAALYNET